MPQPPPRPTPAVAVRGAVLAAAVAWLGQAELGGLAEHLRRAGRGAGAGVFAWLDRRRHARDRRFLHDDPTS